MKFIYCMLLALPFGVAAQKMKLTGYDKFIKQPGMETETQLIVNSADAKLSLALAGSASTLYLKTIGERWGSATIDVGDPLLLTLSNGAVVTAKSIALQSFHPDPAGSTYEHEYRLKPEDAALLSKYDLVSIRKYMFTEFADLKIPAAGALKLKSLSTHFLDELVKMVPAEKPLHRIELRDIGSYVGDSVVFCGNVFITRSFESLQNQASILDFQSSLTTPKARAIIWKEDRKKLGDLPKAFYTDKQVCIKGLVYLYENTPYIRITDKSQLKVTSPVTTDEARFFVGDSITLKGVIENVSHNPSLNNALVLVLRTPGSGQSVKLLMGSKEPVTDTGRGETFYLNKTVEVTGQVSRLGNKIEMTVSGQNAMRLMENVRAN